MHLKAVNYTSNMLNEDNTYLAHTSHIYTSLCTSLCSQNTYLFKRIGVLSFTKMLPERYIYLKFYIIALCIPIFTCVCSNKYVVGF